MAIADVRLRPGVDDLERYLSGRYRSGVEMRKEAKTLPRVLVKQALTKGGRPLAVRKAKRLARSEQPLKLHLGCGPWYLEGWANIDFATPGRQQDLNWDLRWGLPFPDHSVDAIFSEHTIIHLTLSQVYDLFKECARTLKPDGLLRLSFADLEYYVRQYLGDGMQSAPADEPIHALPSIGLNEIAYFYELRSMLDYDLVEFLLASTGFRTVYRSAYGEGALQPTLDQADRRVESLYVEARR